MVQLEEELAQLFSAQPYWNAKKTHIWFPGTRDLKS